MEGSGPSKIHEKAMTAASRRCQSSLRMFDSMNGITAATIGSWTAWARAPRQYEADMLIFHSSSSASSSCRVMRVSRTGTSSGNATLAKFLDSSSGVSPYSLAYMKREDGSPVKRNRRQDVTCKASLFKLISSSQTVDQNSTACMATLLSGCFIPKTVNFQRSQCAVKYQVRSTTYAEQCLFHIKAHVVVIIGHDRHEALKGSDLNGRTRVLCGFANNLHDVISLTLEIGTSWFKRETAIVR